MLRQIKPAAAALRVGFRAYQYVVPNFSKIMEQEKPIGIYTSEQYEDIYEGRDGVQSWKEFETGFDEFDHVNAGKGMRGESRAFRKKQKKESFFAWLNTLKPNEKKIPGSDLGSCVRSKYFALLPFFLESKLEWPKHYVVRLELYPEGKTLRFICLGVSGDYEILAKIDSIIPITSQDYAKSHYFCGKQAYFLDLDMAYAHHGTKEVFVFNKFGKWLKEGVEHDALSLQNTYDELKWMEGYFPHSYRE